MTHIFIISRSAEQSLDLARDYPEHWWTQPRKLAYVRKQCNQLYSTTKDHLPNVRKDSPKNGYRTLYAGTVEARYLAYCKGKRTADAVIDGLEWEFKTPHTPTTHALDHLLRKATKQSHNIVVDLRHFSPSVQTASIKKLEYLSRQLKSLRKLKVLTGGMSKSSKILDIIK